MQGDRSVVVARVESVVALVACAELAEAQDTGSWWRVDVVRVKPERLSDFIKLNQDEINPALQKAGVPWRSAWQTGEFGETYERLFITPIANLEELDSGGPLGRVLEPRAFDRLHEKLRRAIDRQQSYAVRYRADLSVESDDVSGLAIARVANVEVAPGRDAEFEAFLRQNLETFREAGVVFGVYQRQFGPGPVVWQIVENLRSYSDLGRGTILRAFGSEAGAAASGLAGVIRSVERTVIAYDSALSFTGVARP